ncbi:MAG: hypothetical protein A3K10_16230 [Bacteroidetes bacterium RIFCSPLOWO2_12_FULL_31_6]|nr:MAG: hypothetical protein A3K10_16230 [Bacteroidetes bacterium RIFCSPLOWO2_12_FULL_31_6]
MKTPKEISDFYDKYTEQQQRMWHNERHYFLLEQLKKSGLKSNSIILEIGCGVGTMTNLIAPYVKNGKIVSSDISEKSIEFARINNKQFKNLEFIAANSIDFTFPDLNYDFIILFDVMEHIQAENRNDFIHNIAKVMQNNTKLLINVPAPHAHIHAIKNFPEQMQIVEIPVFLTEFSSILSKNELDIKSFFTYDMWQNDEYQFYTVEKIKPYVFSKTIPDRKFNPQSIDKRINRKISKLKG